MVSLKVMLRKQAETITANQFSDTNAIYEQFVQAYMFPYIVDLFIIRIDKLILRDFPTEAGAKAVQIAWENYSGYLQKVRLEIISDEGITCCYFNKFFCLNNYIPIF